MDNGTKVLIKMGLWEEKPVFILPRREEDWRAELEKLSPNDRQVLVSLLQASLPSTTTTAGTMKRREVKPKGELNEKDIILLACRFVVAKSPLPILSHLCFHNGRVEATDLEQGISLSINSGFGKLTETLHAKTLQGIVKPENQVEVLSEQETRVNGTTIICLPESEFPIFPKPEGEPTIIVSSREFAEVLRDAELFTAAPDESRCVLTGINFSGKNCAATDGRRLFVVPFETKSSCTVPGNFARTFQAVYKALGNKPCKLWLYDDTLHWSIGTTTGFTRLLEGEYPNYDALIREESLISMTINKDSFREAIRTALTTAQELINPGLTKITFGNNKVNIYSKTADLGKTSIDLPCVTKGELAIAFSGRFMLDVIAVTKTENLTLLFKDKESSVHFEQGCMMPIRLKEEVYS